LECAVAALCNRNFCTIVCQGRQQVQRCLFCHCVLAQVLTQNNLYRCILLLCISWVLALVCFARIFTRQRERACTHHPLIRYQFGARNLQPGHTGVGGTGYSLRACNSFSSHMPCKVQALSVDVCECTAKVTAKRARICKSLQWFDWLPSLTAQERCWPVSAL